MEKRFAEMEQIARSSIVTGTCTVPILPGLCDTDENLEIVVRWMAERGGEFLLASTLTLADQRLARFQDRSRNVVAHKIEY